MISEYEYDKPVDRALDMAGVPTHHVKSLRIITDEEYLPGRDAEVTYCYGRGPAGMMLESVTYGTKAPAPEPREVSVPWLVLWHILMAPALGVACLLTWNRIPGWLVDFEARVWAKTGVPE